MREIRGWNREINPRNREIQGWNREIRGWNRESLLGLSQDFGTESQNPQKSYVPGGGGRAKGEEGGAIGAGGWHHYNL